jgi:PTH1 family peptidyl-tRNA hydrolase
MRLVIGLGNPGRRYVNNRHNVGFRCIDWLAREHGISLDSRRSRSYVGTGHIGDSRVVLAKPRTYMNLSGEAVRGLMHRYDVPVQNILVVYDDLDLPLGKIRIREKGSSGGHKGMKSIIAQVGSQDFPRLRVGIAPLVDTEGLAPCRQIDAVEHVLGDFSTREKAVIRKVYPDVVAAIDCLVAEGIKAAMNKYN